MRAPFDLETLRYRRAKRVARENRHIMCFKGSTGWSVLSFPLFSPSLSRKTANYVNAENYNVQ